MKLTLIIPALCAFLVSGMSVYFSVRSQRITNAGLEQVHRLQENAVVHYADTVVASRIYLAESLGIQVGQDPQIAKALLLAKDPRSQQTLAEARNRLARLSDASRVNFSTSRPEPTVISTVDGVLALSVSSPIRLYSDVVGSVVFQFDLNQGAATEIEKATQAKVVFVAKKGMALQSVPELGVELRGNSALGKISMKISSQTAGASLASVLVAAAVFYLLFLFKRRIEAKTRIEAVGEKAAQVAHDLQGPLTALEMVLDLKSMENPKRRVVLEGLLSRLRSVVTTVREESREHPLGQGNLNQLIEEIIDEKQVQYADRPVRLSMDGESAAEAYCDPNALKRILSNLIDNAIQAGADRVHIEGHLTPEGACIQVRDNGRGFQPEVLARVGERGNSGDRVRGSGLGLWHAKRCLAEWGGELSIQSSQDSGSSVLLVLRGKA